MKALDLSLDLLPKGDRRALDRALFFKPTIKNDYEFKMMFLRVDNFDPANAAKRIARHFEEKMLLFGESRLTKKITLDDLSPDDINQLGSVGYGILPFQTGAETDGASKQQQQQLNNRPIWLLNIPNVKRGDPDSVVSMSWDERSLRGRGPGMHTQWT